MGVAEARGGRKAGGGGFKAQTPIPLLPALSQNGGG